MSVSVVILLCAIVLTTHGLNTTNARQAVPGYELVYPRTNEIGVGAAAAAVSGQIFVVGGSGDRSGVGAASTALRLVFGDTRRYDIASRGKGLPNCITHSF